MLLKIELFLEQVEFEAEFCFFRARDCH